MEKRKVLETLTAISLELDEKIGQIREKKEISVNDLRILKDDLYDAYARIRDLHRSAGLSDY